MSTLNIAMRAILFLFFVFAAVVPSFAASRVALVIGNADYSTGSLRNPEHDVDDIARALTAMGFDVISRKNLTREKMGDALDLFAVKLRRADVAFFFYSGHGMELEKQNYLIPVDADFDTVRLSAVRNGNLKLDEVLETMTDSGSKVNIAVVDACRDNPYPARMKGARRKLARIPPAEGTIIAYGTSAKSQAGDGNGRNGIYTSELLKVISQPGLNMLEIFRRTGVAVKEATGGKQRPQISYEPMRPFYLSGQAPEPLLESFADSMQNEIDQLREQNKDLDELLREQNKDLENSISTVAQQESGRREEATIQELDELLRTQERNVQAIQQARIKEAERKAKEAAREARMAAAQREAARLRTFSKTSNLNVD